MTLLKVLAVVAALSWSSSALAHHPFEAEFDRNQPQTITGKVTKVEWQNPHVYAHVDAMDADGKMTAWKVEMGGPNALMKEGWTRTSVKVGDEVTIQGFRGKMNETMLNAESFTLADGKSVSAASSMQMGGPEGQIARETTSEQAEPIGTSGTQAGAPEFDALPSTASPLVLYGLTGLLAAGAAFGIRRFRR